jgi:mRNA interferase MazF
MMMRGTMPQPSEIVLLPFPFTDLSSAKRRPVLVLSFPNDQGDFMAVQITSQVRYEPALPLSRDDFELGDLPKSSIVRPVKVFTLNSSLIIRRVGRLHESSFRRIRNDVCAQLGCDRLPRLDRLQQAEAE